MQRPTQLFHPLHCLGWVSQAWQLSESTQLTSCSNYLSEAPWGETSFRPAVIRTTSTVEAGHLLLWGDGRTDGQSVSLSIDHQPRQMCYREAAPRNLKKLIKCNIGRLCAAGGHSNHKIICHHTPNFKRTATLALHCLLACSSIA